MRKIVIVSVFLMEETKEIVVRQIQSREFLVFNGKNLLRGTKFLSKLDYHVGATRQSLSSPQVGK